jgi:hypothetical protein
MRRLSPGDVLEVESRGFRSYLQYLGRHREYGDGILVSPERYESRPELNATMFQNAYVVFYPASAALKRGLVQFVGSLPNPGLPTEYRREGATSSGGKVETWVIESSLGLSVTPSLSDRERSLPIAQIWNHEMLVKMIAAKWRPEQEV